MNHAGLSIKSLRERKGLSQWVVAKAIGRSQSYLSNLELGYREPKEDVLEHILATIAVLPNRNKQEKGRGMDNAD